MDHHKRERERETKKKKEKNKKKWYLANVTTSLMRFSSKLRPKTLRTALRRDALDQLRSGRRGDVWMKLSEERKRQYKWCYTELTKLPTANLVLMNRTFQTALLPVVASGWRHHAGARYCNWQNLRVDQNFGEDSIDVYRCIYIYDYILDLPPTQ